MGLLEVDELIERDGRKERQHEGGFSRRSKQGELYAKRCERQIFSRLLETEAARRPVDERVRQALTRCGFVRVQSCTLWETRKMHLSMAPLGDDIVKRTGRALLYALTDEETLLPLSPALV